MKYITIGNREVSVLAAGCMRIAGMTKEDIRTYIIDVLNLGINFFDHADIYGGGRSEELFGAILKEEPSLREKIFLQSKCGIRKGWFDFSYDHIMESVNGSLERLGTDHLDSLLLHRPDVLMKEGDVKRAFRDLHKSGKILHFGVSNMNRYQMEFLQSAVDVPLFTDQLQMSIVHTPLIDAGLNVNMSDDPSIMRDAGTLEYLRKERKILQVWSPLQIGYFEGTFLGSDRYKELNEVLEEIAGKYHTTKDAIAIAWPLRLPLDVQVVLGSTNIAHLGNAVKAADIRLEKEEWYRLYRAAGNRLP